MNLRSFRGFAEPASELVETNYLAAEKFWQAEQIAFEQREFETLARLYMPLQGAEAAEAKCGEGDCSSGADCQIGGGKTLCGTNHRSVSVRAVAGCGLGDA
jgi:hypothetical protein